MSGVGTGRLRRRIVASQKRTWEVTIAVPGTRPPWGKRLIWPGLNPATTGLLASVVLQVDLLIVRTPAADQVEMEGIPWVVRQENGWLTKQVVPQIGVELAIAEMVGVFEVTSDRGKEIDHLPEFIRQVRRV